MQIDFDGALAGCDLLTDIDVRVTPKPLELIEVRGKRANPSSSVEELEAEVERIWINELRYQNYEIHSVTRSTTTLRLRALTVIDKAFFYVSASITIDL